MDGAAAGLVCFVRIEEVCNVSPVEHDPLLQRLYPGDLQLHDAREVFVQHGRGVFGVGGKTGFAVFEAGEVLGRKRELPVRADERQWLHHQVHDACRGAVEIRAAPDEHGAVTILVIVVFTLGGGEARHAAGGDVFEVRVVEGTGHTVSRAG
jgi:hypothetical protein